MELDASGVQEIKGVAKEILGAVSFLIEVKEIKIQNTSKIKGIGKGKKLMVWLAGLRIEKPQVDKCIEYLNELLKNKEVSLIPDPFRPNKQGHINAHVYLQEKYINEIVVKNEMIGVDDKMQGSPYWKKLKDTEIVIRTQLHKRKTKINLNS